MKNLIEQQELLAREISRVRQAKLSEPEGYMKIDPKHGKPNYYLVNRESPSGRYLSKRKEMELVRQLAQKDYNQKLIKRLEEQEKRIRNIIAFEKDKNSSDIYNHLSKERQALVTPSIFDSAYSLEWEKVRYEGKRFDEDAPEIYTEKNERVRSKSEKLIADKLYQMGISYRYEYPMVINGYGTIYPDFTIWNPYRYIEYIWEHFGRMDDPEYAQKAIKKIRMYEKLGYYMGEKLIVTFETSITPIDMRYVEKMLLENYFVDENKCK